MKKKIHTVNDDVLTELVEALDKWPTFNSQHEGYGVIAEELRKLEHEVFLNQKKRNLDKTYREAIQLAAMAMRFAIEVCDEERGRK